MQVTQYPRPFIAAATFVLACLGFCGCGRGSAEGESAIYLEERFSLTAAGVPKALERHIEVVRKGQKRESIILVAPSIIRAPLQGALKDMTLKFDAAPVFDVGDGIQMGVFLIRAGNRVSVGSRYFDSGRKAEDRSWIPVELPLSLGPGDELEIEVSGGPQGDLVADWLALSSVRLTPR